MNTLQRDWQIKSKLGHTTHDKKSGKIPAFFVSLLFWGVRQNFRKSADESLRIKTKRELFLVRICLAYPPNERRAIRANE